MSHPILLSLALLFAPGLAFAGPAAPLCDCKDGCECKDCECDKKDGEHGCECEGDCKCKGEKSDCGCGDEHKH